MVVKPLLERGCASPVIDLFCHCSFKTCYVYHENDGAVSVQEPSCLICFLTKNYINCAAKHQKFKL